VLNILVAATAIAASSSVPTAKERAAVSRAVGQSLKDAASAQFRWQKKQSGAVYCAEVNSKNSYGGYSGFSKFLVVFKDRLGLADPSPVVMIGEVDGPMVETVSKTCSEAGYFKKQR
jgi:hypothetical protein